VAEEPVDDGWSALADWYDTKQGESGDLWHRSLIDPGLLRQIGDVRGLRLLDLGCGNGYLARRLARLGATVVAVDVTAGAIDRARARGDADGRVTYRLADAAHLSELASGSFDLAYSNMALMDMPETEEALREVGRLLRPDGRFVASISHPCFDNGLDSTWLVEKSPLGRVTIGRVMRSYREPFRAEVPWAMPDGTTRRTGSYHRPLSWYARALADAGLLIEALDEPAPLPEMLGEANGEGPWIAQVPLHLVIAARAVPGRIRPGAGSGT
jgi:ubiquinone/menaquinone biosynthesis C-methylase UbiE